MERYIGQAAQNKTQPKLGDVPGFRVCAVNAEFTLSTASICEDEIVCDKKNVPESAGYSSRRLDIFQVAGTILFALHVLVCWLLSA